MGFVFIPIYIISYLVLCSCRIVYSIMLNSVASIVSIWVLGTALNGIMHIPYVAQLSYGWFRLTMIINEFFIMVIIP